MLYHISLEKSPLNLCGYTYSFIVSFEAVVYSISSQAAQAALCEGHATQIFSLFEYSVDFLHCLSESGLINLLKSWTVGWEIERPILEALSLTTCTLFEVTLPLSSLGKSVENLTAVP